MGSIPLDENYVIAFWLSTLLFGVHIVMYILFIWAYRQCPSNRHVLLHMTATAMLIMGSINNFVGLQRVITAFWGNTGQSAAAFLNNTSVASNFVESISWIIQVALGDAFLTYRCWLIYGKHWWALVPPGALVLATFVMGAMLQVEYGKSHAMATNFEVTQALFRWEAAMLVLTAVLNLSLTVAIASKIWWKHRQLYRSLSLVSRIGQPRYMRIMWTIMESGLLVSVSQVLALALCAVDNPGYLIVLHAVNPIIGIAFTGIIVRLQLYSRVSVTDSAVTQGPAFVDPAVESSGGSTLSPNLDAGVEPKADNCVILVHSQESRESEYLSA